MKFLRYLTAVFTIALMAGCADLPTTPDVPSTDDRGHMGSDG